MCRVPQALRTTAYAMLFALLTGTLPPGGTRCEASLRLHSRPWHTCFLRLPDFSPACPLSNPTPLQSLLSGQGIHSNIARLRQGPAGPAQCGPTRPISASNWVPVTLQTQKPSFYPKAFACMASSVCNVSSFCCSCCSSPSLTFLLQIFFSMPSEE